MQRMMLMVLLVVGTAATAGVETHAERRFLGKEPRKSSSTSNQDC